MDSKPNDKRRRNEILASTWVAYAGFYFCRKTFYVAKSSLRDELNFSVEQLGDLGAAYLIAYTIGQFLSAGLGKRFGARRLLLCGMVVSLLTNIVFGITDAYASFMVFMVINGLAQSTGWPSVVGTLGAWTKRKERGVIMGFWATCYQVGSIAAKAFAAFWLSQQGYRTAFFMGSLILVFATVVVFIWQRNTPEDRGLDPIEDDDDDDDLEQERSGSSDRRWVYTGIVLLGVFYFGVKFIRYAIWSWAPLLLEDRLGVSSSDAAYLSTVFDAAGFCGVIFAGVGSDRWFKSRRVGISVFMMIGMAAGCVALASVGVTTLFSFALCLGIIGFMLYGPDALLTGAGAIDVGDRRTALVAAGVINGMGSLGSVLQETLVSRLLAQSPDSPLVFVALSAASVISVAALFVLWILSRKGLSRL